MNDDTTRNVVVKEMLESISASARKLAEAQLQEVNVKKANADFFSLGPEKRAESCKTVTNDTVLLFELTRRSAVAHSDLNLFQTIGKLFAGKPAVAKLGRPVDTYRGVKEVAKVGKLVPRRKEMTVNSSGPRVTSGPIAPANDDQLVLALRTSYGQSASAATGSQSFERERAEILRRWILASVLVFFVIVSVALVGWIYTSPTLDKSGLVSDTAGAPGAANGTPKSTLSAGSKINARVMGETKKLKGNGRNAAPAPAVNTGAPADRVEAINEKQVKPRGGRVSLHPGPETPEAIVLPAYPTAALLQNVQGRVTLKAVISPQGTLRNIRLVGEPSLLSAAVIEAVSKWRYRPRIQSGLPIELETQISIDFER